MFNLIWFVCAVALVIGSGIYAFYLLNNDKAGKKFDGPGVNRNRNTDAHA